MKGKPTNIVTWSVYTAHAHKGNVVPVLN